MVPCNLRESLPAECLTLFMVAVEMETAEMEGLGAKDEEFRRVVAIVLVRSERGFLFDDDDGFSAAIVSYFTSHHFWVCDC